MTQLPEVTVVAITTKDYGKTVEAIHKTLQHIKPAKVLLFTDVIYTDDAWQNIIIDRFKSVEDYNHFVFKKLGDYIKTSHVLIIQWDGYVIDGSVWNQSFLDYDYIGAPWTYTDGRNVGNGGFSLRSRRLHKILQGDEFDLYSPEDEKICRYYRQTLEMKHGIVFAPESVASKFSFEMQRPTQPTLGFHNYFHKPYREPIILRRTGAMGDVIMLEPVMEALYNSGYRVIIDTPRNYFHLFSRHRYTVELLSDLAMEATSGYRVVDMDMVYEVTPKQHVIKSYAAALGLDIELRNPKLVYNGEGRLFNKYIVLHTDDTAMPHRNVHGVDWEAVANELMMMGWIVLRVGRGNGKGGWYVNCHNEAMLAWVISGATYFIGIDSGCAQIAVACGVKSMIFFGSVNPKYRYVLDESIKVMQKPCPIGKDHCYHDLISTVGKACEVDVNMPPCITHDSREVFESIKQFIS